MRSLSAALAMTTLLGGHHRGGLRGQTEAVGVPVANEALVARGALPEPRAGAGRRGRVRTEVLRARVGAVAMLEVIADRIVAGSGGRIEVREEGPTVRVSAVGPC